ncbi:LCP family protein [Microbacteriaceae bacterium 4G12]
MDPNLRYVRTEKNRSKKRRILLFIVLPLMLIIAGGVGYGSYIYNKAKAAANNAFTELDRGGKSEKREKAVAPLKDNISLLIMGVDESDERQSDYGTAIRTDALLLMTINKDDKSIKLVSIPRDSRVYIPSLNKKDKIAHAHVFGGVDNTINTVERFLDVPVDYYVKFNFKSFIKIVDTLGGIDVDVPINFSEQDSHGTPNAIRLTKGYQHLNGEQALALARTRHVDSDYMRGQRQELVLDAIAHKAASLQSVSKLSSLIDAVGADMKTNLTFDDTMAITKNMIGSQLQMEKMQIKGEDKYIMTNGNNIYYYEPDQDSVKKISNELKQHLDVSNKSEHKKVQ